jgi:hypothetical protein
MNLVYRSSKGCPVLTKGKVTDFVEQYKIPIGATMILLGIFLCFFGNTFIKAVVFILGFVSISACSSYGSFLLLDNITNKNVQDW